MAYKRYFNRNGKKLGPYFYESYRDDSGKVRKKYVGTKNPDKKLRIITPTIILAVFVLVMAFVILQVSKSDIGISSTRKAISEMTGSAYNSIAKIIGLSVQDTEQPEEEQTQEQQEEQPADVGVTEETAGQEEQAQEQAQQETPEQPVGEQGTEITVPEEDIAEEANITIPEETPEPTDEEINITIPENITEILENETVENIPNISLPENITEIKNITNETIPETIENATKINITIPEENITVINETITNITETNFTIINETIVNVPALNITTKQYKAVINRPVKWLKTVRIDNLTVIRNLTLELPKQAENITVKTGKEIQEALREIEEYEGVIDNTNRNNLITGKVTGYAELDIKNSMGILTRLWRWLTSLTITGKVIQEQELQEEITDASDSKIIDLENIANQTQEGDIAVEYYTDAPTSVEENISRGKKVIISGPDELNYTEVLAYSLLDNRISINNSEKIKVYWVKEAGIPEVQEETTGEQLEEQESIINETKEQAEITENIILPIINEPIANETELIINETAEEERQVIEEEQITNETVSGQQTEETTSNPSLITGFAINEQNLDENEINNLTDNQLLGGNISEQEASQTQTSIAKTTREEVNFSAYDLDEDGFIDYVEWNVEHLSNQTYEIIYITKAEHLDENYTFIEEVYEQVKEKDNNYTLIPNEDYLRVTFEKPLDKTKDITIYARAKDNCSVSENNLIVINEVEVSCEIYDKKKRIDEIRRILKNE